MALAARDYTALWGAGRIAAEHATSVLSDPVQFTALLRAWFGSAVPEQIWPYPPPILFVARALAALPFQAGLVLYTLGNVALLGAMLRGGGFRWAHVAAITLSPAVAENALAGQNGAVTAALLVGGLLIIDRRPLLAGVLLGALVYKPQFLVLLPICLIAGQRWSTIAASCATSAVIALLSAQIFGYSVWVEFITRAQPFISAFAEAPWQAQPAQLIFTSVFMAARSLGAGLLLSYCIQAAALVFSAGMAWRVWRKPGVSPPLRAAATASATLLAAPWVHTYDMPALACAIVILLPGSRRNRRLVLAVAWIMPGLASLLDTPPLLAALSVACVAILAGRASEPAAQSS